MYILQSRWGCIVNETNKGVILIVFFLYPYVMVSDPGVIWGNVNISFLYPNLVLDISHLSVTFLILWIQEMGI